MSFLSVNGIEFKHPLSPDATFHELLEFLRRNITSGAKVISSVKVNGNEVDQALEEQIAAVPISQLESIEVTTLHPLELAQETLQDTLEFIAILINLCQKIATHVGEPGFYSYMTQLVDGIGYLTEAITHVKKILKIGPMPAIDTLEERLLVVLRDLLKSQEEGRQDLMAELLLNQLLPNFQQWLNVGIPALIRSRDC